MTVSAGVVGSSSPSLVMSGVERPRTALKRSLSTPASRSTAASSSRGPSQMGVAEDTAAA
eukprot:scaffold63_cov306-Pinguiococcus_pyrenoidosus.AAC.53